MGNTNDELCMQKWLRKGVCKMDRARMYWVAIMGEFLNKHREIKDGTERKMICWHPTQLGPCNIIHCFSSPQYIGTLGCGQAVNIIIHYYSIHSFILTTWRPNCANTYVVETSGNEFCRCEYTGILFSSAIMRYRLQVSPEEDSGWWEIMDYIGVALMY